MPKDLTEYAKQNDIQLLSHNDARGKGRSVIYNAVHGDMELSFLEHESLVSLFLYKMDIYLKGTKLFFNERILLWISEKMERLPIHKNTCTRYVCSPYNPTVMD